MPDSWLDVRRWRAMAEETRAVTANFAHAASKRTMLTIAETYERLADEAEQRLKRAGIAPGD